MKFAGENVNNGDALKVIFASLVSVGKLFLALNSQDLPEFFEDNMAVWMEHFLSLLNFTSPLLASEDDEIGVLEQVGVGLILFHWYYLVMKIILKGNSCRLSILIIYYLKI